MNSKIFLYNRFASFILYLPLAILVFIPTFSYINDHSLTMYWQFWLVFLAISLATIVMAIYYCKKYTIPALRADIALELDSEKLEFYIDDKTIYWKDVFDVEIEYVRNKTFIRFKMKEEYDDPVINITLVAGKSTYIVEQVQEYFKKYFVPLP